MILPEILLVNLDYRGDTLPGSDTRVLQIPIIVTLERTAAHPRVSIPIKVLEYLTHRCYTGLNKYFKVMYYCNTVFKKKHYSTIYLKIVTK